MPSWDRFGSSKAVRELAARLKQSSKAVRDLAARLKQTYYRVSSEESNRCKCSWKYSFVGSSYEKQSIPAHSELAFPPPSLGTSSNDHCATV